MSEKAKCPHCNNLIDCLGYKEEGVRYYHEYYTANGTCSLEGDDCEEDDCDFGDSESDDSESDSINYYCPECDHSINPDDLEVISDGETIHRTTPKPNPSADSSDLLDNRHVRGSQSLTFFVCIKCETKVEILSDDDSGSFNGKSKHGECEVRCTKCGRKITAKTSKLIIKV